MLISETHFTHKNYLKIPQYSIYVTNHPDGKSHGGTAIIIKSNIKHYVLENTSNDYLQATGVTIEDNKGSITNQIHNQIRIIYKIFPKPRASFYCYRRL